MPYSLLLAMVCAVATPSWNEVPFGEKTLLLHPKCEPLAGSLLGPFVKLGDGSVMAVDAGRVMVSGDAGKSWVGRPLFGEPGRFLCRGERAVLRTRRGTLILALMNEKERVFRWDQARGGPQPGCRLPVYVARSSDDGKTWQAPQLHRLSYPYVFERVPGELWVTTMQGPLRIKLAEDDFLPRRISDATYRVRYLPKAGIRLDGRLDDPAWSKAAVEKHFIFPWKEADPPPTEFRAVCDDAHLYFAFRMEDADVFVLDELRGEEDAVFEDRAEMYFVCDDRMKDYYCIEIDSRGRTFDYRAGYYRRFEPGWNWKGLETKGLPTPNGYAVEGRIPLAGFAAMGFPALRPGAKIRCGLYRAEFSHDRSGRPVEPQESLHTLGRRLAGPPPIEAWMSWVDPKTVEPDFHVPTSLGWLEVVE